MEKWGTQHENMFNIIGLKEMQFKTKNYNFILITVALVITKKLENNH